MKDFVYNIANTKAYGHVMINVNDWYSTSMLSIVNMKGRRVPTNITKVVDINMAPAYKNIPVTIGSLIAISAPATQIARLRNFVLPNDDNIYANVHMSQILGYFKDNILSIDSFVPIYDKVLLKKIEVPVSHYLDITTDTISVGEVVRTGDGGFDDKWKRIPIKVQEGEQVLVKDNISTSLFLDNEEYFVVDDKAVIGKWNNVGENYAYDLSDIQVYNDINLFKEYEETTIEGSFLLKPPFDKEEDDISENYVDHLFELVKSNTLEDGIYYIERIYTERARFKGQTYFIANTNRVMAVQAKEEITLC